MQHGAHSAEEERVDELPRAFPLEVGVVEVVVAVELVKEVGQVLRRFEVVDVKVGVLRRGPFVVVRMGSHHDRQHVRSAAGKWRSVNEWYAHHAVTGFDLSEDRY